MHMQCSYSIKVPHITVCMFSPCSLVEGSQTWLDLGGRAHWKNYQSVDHIYFYSSYSTFLTLRKRSVWDQCKKYEYWRLTDDRPTWGPIHTFWRISNGHNSATRQPISFMFGSRVGFSGSADRTAPFPVGSNPRWRPTAILKNIERPCLWNALSNSLYVWTQVLPLDTTMTDDAYRMTGDWTLISQVGRWVTSRPMV